MSREYCRIFPYEKGGIMEIGIAIQLGILIFLIMIYFSTRSLVEVLNHWGVRQEKQLDDIRDKLEER